MLRAGCERVAKSVWTGRQAQAGKESERGPMSFALLALVLVMAAVALVLLLYYVLGRWL
jgi:cobalamin biosynthesis Mg chelatase CobN